MKKYEVNLNIPSEKIIAYYKGHVQHVVAHTQCGRTIQFPVQNLRAFVDQQGVHGRFLLTVDENGKLKGFERITP